MDNRPNGYSNQNRYNGQGNYYQQNRRQQIPNGRMTNNAPQRSGAVPTGRRTFSKPQKRSFANRVFRDRRGKLNVLGRIAVGALTISTLTGAAVTGKYAYDTLKFNSFVHSNDYQRLVDVIQDNYDNSEYLQVSIPEEAYTDYAEGTLKATIKNEPNMQSFLETEEFDPNVWAYLLTGEVDRSTMDNEEIIDALSDYLPYAEYDSNSSDEEVLDNNISNFAIMSQYCTSDKNKNGIVNLLDAIIGQSSLSNGKGALQYKIKLNEEEIERIEYNTPEELINKCYINNNFDKLACGQDATYYFKPYVYNFYNSRVDFMKDKLGNADTPKLLKDALEKYVTCEKMDGVRKELRTMPEEMMNATKIATYDEYMSYASLRNEFYNRIIEEQKTPEESIAKIEEVNTQLGNRIEIQSVIESFDIPQYMRELNGLIEDMRDSKEKYAEAEKEQNRVDEKARDLGFDGFDR